MICQHCKKTIQTVDVSQVGTKGEITCSQCIKPVEAVETEAGAVNLLRTGMNGK